MEAQILIALKSVVVRLGLDTGCGTQARHGCWRGCVKGKCEDPGEEFKELDGSNDNKIETQIKHKFISCFYNSKQSLLVFHLCKFRPYPILCSHSAIVQTQFFVDARHSFKFNLYFKILLFRQYSSVLILHAQNKGGGNQCLII